jgi:dienelactone hydrolase
MNIHKIVIYICILLILSGNSCVSLRHDLGDLDKSLSEEVIFIPAETPNGSVKLETTVFHPSISGKHPIVIINHGANGHLPNFHQQERFRPLELARFFIDRGYLVTVPMHEGFAQSTGNCIFHCNHAQYALTYARDITAVIDYFIERKMADSTNVLVIGQSNGGIVTLGYAASNPIAKAVINISGGIDTDDPNCNWKAGMMNAGTVLGAKTLVPSLWLYAKDDPIFPPSVSKPFFEAYNSGGKAQMTLFSQGGHGFALQDGSQQIWGATIKQFLQSVGLPFEIVKN